MPLRRPVALFALLAATALPAAAQSRSPLTIGLGAGLGAATGDISDSYEAPFALLGYAQYGLSDRLGVRADLGWSYFDTKTNAPNVFGGAGRLLSGNLRLLTGSAALVYRLAAVSDFRPYVVGGVSLMTAMSEYRRVSPTTPVSDTQTRVGVLGGIGADFTLAGARLFVEGRYQAATVLDKQVGMVPVMIGFRF